MESIQLKRNTVKKELKSEMLNEFLLLRNKDKMTTIKEIRQRLITFEEFVYDKYKKLIDSDFVYNTLTLEKKESKIKKNKIYVFDMLVEYVRYLEKKKLSRERIKYLLVYARMALNNELDGRVDMDRYRSTVISAFPDSKKQQKTTITIKDIQKVLFAASGDKRLFTILLLLSSTGMRIGELLKVKWKYVNLEWSKNDNVDVPPFIFLPSQITKTKRERRAWLTAEAVATLEEWYNYKHRMRKIVRGKNNSVDYVKPENIGETYVFRMSEDFDLPVEEREKNMITRYRNTYKHISIAFKKIVKEKNLGKKFVNERNSVSLHSLRWYVVDKIESLDNLTSAYYWVGKHQKDYLFPERDPEKVLELYKKVESSLTFANPEYVEERNRKEMEELKNQNIVLFFKLEIEQFARISKERAEEEIKKKGGKLRSFEWLPEKQIEYFEKRRSKIDKKVSEEEKKILKKYSEPVKAWIRVEKDYLDEMAEEPKDDSDEEESLKLNAEKTKELKEYLKDHPEEIEELMKG